MELMSCARMEHTKRLPTGNSVIFIYLIFVPGSLILMYNYDNGYCEEDQSYKVIE